MAPRTDARRGPRAHWALLGLLLLVLLAELCLHGYATGAAGDGATAPKDNGKSAELKAPVLRLSGDRTQTVAVPAKTIALTFDDGPDPRWTPQILAVLAHYHAHATFFQIGAHVDDHPDLTRAVLAQGSEVGLHTFTHPSLTAASGWRRHLEIALSGDSIAGAGDVAPTLMRPPYSSTPAAATVADLSAWRDVARSGYLIVLADRDTDDWKRPGVSSIVKAATPAGGAGAIVLMHDGGGDRSQTVAALRVLIPKLQQQGYRFTTVSDAIGLDPAPPAGAVRHWQGVILRVLQQGGGAISTAMIWVLILGLALGLVRLPFQIAGAMAHQARQRRRQRLRYLGGVSVIVPAYNEAANIAATVRSLYASDYPHFEIIVVDDGSTDATTDIVRSLRLPDVQVIRQPNAGKPAALNTGIAHARYQILVLVDGDTIFEPDALGRLIQPLADRRVGAVSGNTKVANRGRLLGRWQHLEYVIGFNLDRRLFDVAGCMPTVPGAIGAFRRDAIADVGGVSDQTLAEDTDLTIAVGAAGWRIVYVPDAIAHTEAPSTLRQLWRQRYRWCYGTMQAMWKHKHAIGRRGPAGRMGRRGLSYLLVFQVVLPLAAPAVDVYAIYGLVFLPVWRAVAVWAALVVVQMATAAYALRLDGERMRTVWALPLQQFVYRQLMYFVVVQSTVMALLGDRLRWHRMHRTGAAAAAMPNRVPTRR